MSERQHVVDPRTLADGTVVEMRDGTDGVTLTAYVSGDGFEWESERVGSRDVPLPWDDWRIVRVFDSYKVQAKTDRPTDNRKNGDVTITVPADASEDDVLAAWRKATKPEPEVRVGDVAWCQVRDVMTLWMERVPDGWLHCFAGYDGTPEHYRDDEVTVLRVLRPLLEGHIAVKVPDGLTPDPSIVERSALRVDHSGVDYDAVAWLAAVADALAALGGEE